MTPEADGPEDPQLDLAASPVDKAAEFPDTEALPESGDAEVADDAVKEAEAVVKEANAVEAGEPLETDVSSDGDADGAEKAETPRAVDAAEAVGDGDRLSDATLDRLSSQDRAEIDGIYRRARMAAEEGRLVEAEKGYRELLRRDPLHIKARNNLGYVYDSLGEPARALEEYQAALEIEPENVQLLTNVGGVLGTLGRYAEAEETLRNAQRLAPEDPDVHLNLGLVFYRKGLYSAARESLERSIVLDPGSESAYYYLGEACNRLGHIDAALEALEHAVQIQPGNGRAWYTMGILFDRKREPERASEAYLKARELLDAD